jgi:hypothetical protein
MPARCQSSRQSPCCSPAAASARCALRGRRFKVAGFGGRASTAQPRGPSPSASARSLLVGHGARQASGLRCQGYSSGPSLSGVISRLTVRSSRRCFATRLNSGVRPRGRTLAVTHIRHCGYCDRRIAQWDFRWMSSEGKYHRYCFECERLYRAALRRGGSNLAKSTKFRLRLGISPADLLEKLRSNAP